MSFLNVCDRVSKVDFSDLLKGAPCPSPFLDQQQFEVFAHQQFGHENVARCVIDSVLQRCSFAQKLPNVDDPTTSATVSVVLVAVFAVIGVLIVLAIIAM